MTRVILSILFLILLTACAPAQMVASPPRAQATPSPVADVVVTPVPDNPYAPREADSALQRGGAMLESQQIIAKEGFVSWYTLVLKGTLPTPCHHLRVAISAPDARNVINVQVYSVFAPKEFCIAVIEPFEAAIRLDGYVAGKYTVLVNGAVAGESETPASRSLKGYEQYGWQSEGR